MTSPLRSIIDAGTKLWLDSVDPDLTVQSRKLGATGATSNPIIVGDLIQSGRFDDKLGELLEAGHDDEAIAWHMTDHLVRLAQDVFAPVWQETAGDDGYVSFELDPLLEDPELGPPHDQRVQRYIELGKQWSAGHDNRMIKVPATAAGLEALEELAAAGVTLNVTLMFTMRQWEAATAAIWRGAQRAGASGGADALKSVYSIFISRVDVYTTKNVPDLSDAAQGQVGLANAKRIWQANQRFWQDRNLPRRQEIVFASTGAKLEGQPADFYIEALVGSDIQTNPPATNDAVEQLGKTYTRTIDQHPPQHVLDEIDAKVNVRKLEDALMEEGVRKFADPQKELLKTIAERRKTLAQA
ncbi:MAG: transaldolase family protein [Phycisphaeraceae bacterium]